MGTAQQPSGVSIDADMPCEVRIISGRELQALFDSDPKMMLHNVRIQKNLFKMVYCLDGDAAPITIRADMFCTVYVVDGTDLAEHHHQSQAADRMGRDYMAYRL